MENLETDGCETPVDDLLELRGAREDRDRTHLFVHSCLVEITGERNDLREHVVNGGPGLFGGTRKLVKKSLKEGGDDDR